MKHKLRRFLKILRSEGASSALRKAAFHVASAAPAAIQPKLDPISHYSHILGRELGLGLKITNENVPQNSMTWLIPDFEASSGGHINILRMMRLLKSHGFENQHVVVMEPHRWSSQAEAQHALNQAFGDHGITLSLGVESIEPCKYLVATGWQTAYWVSKYKDTLHRLYFVQDFEPTFYADGSESILAENTYKLGLTAITAGTWLSNKLSQEYGMKAFPYTFGCDTEFYKRTEKRPSPSKNIFYYARPVTPRRCFEIGLLALAQVCEKNPDVAVIFAGWDVSNYEIPFHHLNAGTVSLEELPDLYSQCDAALVLSATNLSLLPLEIASCGCPLVINDSENANWLLSDEEAFYCDMTVDSIEAQISNVLQNPDKAQAVADAAQKKAHDIDWGSESKKVAKFIAGL